MASARPPDADIEEDSEQDPSCLSQNELRAGMQESRIDSLDKTATRSSDHQQPQQNDSGVLALSQNTDAVHYDVSSEEPFPEPQQPVTIPKGDIPEMYSCEQFDGVMIYTEADEKKVSDFVSRLKRERLSNGVVPKISFWGDAIGQSQFQSVQDGIERSTFMFIFLSSTFVSGCRWADMQREECLMETINNPMKKWSIVPIFLETKTEFAKKRCRLPFGMTSLRGLQFVKETDIKGTVAKSVELLNDRQYLRKEREDKQKADYEDWKDLYLEKKRVFEQHKLVQKERQKEKYIQELRNQLENQTLEETVVPQIDELVPMVLPPPLSPPITAPDLSFEPSSPLPSSALGETWPVRKESHDLPAASELPLSKGTAKTEVKPTEVHHHHYQGKSKVVNVFGDNSKLKISCDWDDDSDSDTPISPLPESIYNNPDFVEARYITPRPEEAAKKRAPSTPEPPVGTAANQLPHNSTNSVSDQANLGMHQTTDIGVPTEGVLLQNFAATGIRIQQEPKPGASMSRSSSTSVDASAGPCLSHPEAGQMKIQTQGSLESGSQDERRKDCKKDPSKRDSQDYTPEVQSNMKPGRATSPVEHTEYYSTESLSGTATGHTENCPEPPQGTEDECKHHSQDPPHGQPVEHTENCAEPPQDSQGSAEVFASYLAKDPSSAACKGSSNNDHTLLPVDPAVERPTRGPVQHQLGGLVDSQSGHTEPGYSSSSSSQMKAPSPRAAHGEISIKSEDKVLDKPQKPPLQVMVGGQDLTRSSKSSPDGTAVVAQKRVCIVSPIVKTSKEQQLPLGGEFGTRAMGDEPGAKEATLTSTEDLESRDFASQTLAKETLISETVRENVQESRCSGVDVIEETNMMEHHLVRREETTTSSEIEVTESGRSNEERKSLLDPLDDVLPGNSSGTSDKPPRLVGPRSLGRELRRERNAQDSSSTGLQGQTYRSPSPSDTSMEIPTRVIDDLSTQPILADQSEAKDLQGSEDSRLPVFLEGSLNDSSGSMELDSRVLESSVNGDRDMRPHFADQSQANDLQGSEEAKLPVFLEGSLNESSASVEVDSRVLEPSVIVDQSTRPHFADQSEAKDLQNSTDSRLPVFVERSLNDSSASVELDSRVLESSVIVDHSTRPHFADQSETKDLQGSEEARLPVFVERSLNDSSASVELDSRILESSVIVNHNTRPLPTDQSEAKDLQGSKEARQPVILEHSHDSSTSVEFGTSVFESSEGGDSTAPILLYDPPIREGNANDAAGMGSVEISREISLESSDASFELSSGVYRSSASNDDDDDGNQEDGNDEDDDTGISFSAGGQVHFRRKGGGGPSSSIGRTAVSPPRAVQRGRRRGSQPDALSAVSSAGPAFTASLPVSYSDTDLKRKHVKQQDNQDKKSPWYKFWKK